jgi:UDP-N-acetylmuramoyl-tripeptide--D-alanyl-D-alanine ligase
VLGNLGELGPDEKQIHRELGIYARDAGLDGLIVVGQLAAEAAQAFGVNAQYAEDHQSAADLVRPILNQAGTVLVKGSRSAGMDAVITALQATEEMH